MQRVFITGGSRGIGAEMVRLFAARGAEVSFTYLSSEREALSLARETGAQALRCDVREEAQVRALLAGRGPRFYDTVIHNAGTAWTGLIQDMPSEAFDDLYAVHVRGAFLCAKYALPDMISSRTGSLLFVSSVWGRQGASCEAAYSACKAALIGLSGALAREVGPSRVRVNCICPGAIATDMLSVYNEEELADIREATPLGRLGTPADVAKAAWFLASGEAAFITGEVLGVTGGFPA